MNLKQHLGYFTKLGVSCFGGPLALCHAIHRDLIEEKKWFSEAEYLQALSLAQLMPGPLATQVAIYLGWLRYGNLGALLTVICFILPSLLMVLVLAALYCRYGELSFIQSLSFGMSGAIIAIMLRAATDLSRKLLGRDLLLWLIAIMAATVTILSHGENFWLFIGAGSLVWAAKRQTSATAKLLSWFPGILITGIHGVATLKTLPGLFFYFLKVGAMVFGSGMVIVPFLHGGVVDKYHWLTEQQFLDACAVAMLTPGPIVIAVAFIGYLVAGLSGGLLASLGIFLPCFLFVVLVAPIYHKIARNQDLHHFIAGVVAAGIGAIFSAACNLGMSTLKFDARMLIFAGSLVLVFTFKKLPAPVLILIAATVGLIVRSI